MLLRTLSALVLIPLVLALLLQGETLHLFLLFLPLSAGLIHEWLGFDGPVDRRLHLLMAAAAWLLLTTGFMGGVGWILVEVMLLYWGLLLMAIYRYQPGRMESEVAGFHFRGLIYTVIPLLMALEIRALPAGGDLLCYLLFVIWATDSGAYLVGRAIGKRKMAPRLSPNKSWEGLIGGILLGVVVGFGTIRGFSLAIDPLWAVLLSFSVALVGELGDLVESLFKREYGVKDSGTLIPGHGGLLDRLDSLLFALPLFYFFLYWQNWFV
ncbi:MAG: phosphatidate cytidylyltransferase [Magnetococcales bacterium]|nr:phosphatidate cytidylyltransferase [Magnetococcales bacterium]